MCNLNFALLFAICGSLLTSNVSTAPMSENQSSDETTTELTTSTSETSTENNSNSTTSTSEISTENISNSKNECPTGWWFLDGNCYFFGKKELSFHKAQNSCMDMNSTLFEPKDLSTNKLVFETARNVSEEWSSKYIFFWIGIHDLNGEGNFTYLSDLNETAIQWTNWNEGEPNNANNGEDCVYAHDHGKWNDMNCTAQSEFICEKPLNGSGKIFTNLQRKLQEDSNSTNQPDPASLSTTTQNLGSGLDSNDEITSIATTNLAKSTEGDMEETTKPSIQKNHSNASPLMDSPGKSGRKFDGWSFFGGIILTVGTGVIAFLGVKYYQAKSIRPQNYNLM